MPFKDLPEGQTNYDPIAEAEGKIKDKIINIISKEIAAAHIAGEHTSRLTRIANKIYGTGKTRKVIRRIINDLESGPGPKNNQRNDSGRTSQKNKKRR